MQEEEMLEILESFIEDGQINHTPWDVVKRQVDRTAADWRRLWGGRPAADAIRRLLDGRKPPAYRWV